MRGAGGRVFCAQVNLPDPAAVRAFFDQWAFYRKIVDRNYLKHREAMAALGGWMDRRLAAPFSFLDMGCGDASFTTAVLAGRPVERYCGIDLSPVALDLARESTKALGVSVDFRCADFSDGPDGRWDVIYVGLSFHHIAAIEAKREFLGRVRAALAPGGFFVFFEPARRNAEVRGDYLARWMEDVRRTWVDLSAEEVAAVERHVTQSDFPETIDDYRRLGAEAGFSASEIVFRDDQDFYAVIAMDR